MRSILLDLGMYIFLPKIFVQRGLSLRRGIPCSQCDTSDAAGPRPRSSHFADIESKTRKMKAVILAYCKQRQNIDGLLLRTRGQRKCDRIGYAYGEYGQFGYKVDAQRASRAAALKHEKRVAR